MQMIVAAQVMVIRGHQGQTSVLLLNHYLMGKEESRWQVLSPRHLDNKTSLLEIETGRDAPK